MNNKGFSLIELMIVLAIIGVAYSLLPTITFIWSTGWPFSIM